MNLYALRTRFASTGFGIGVVFGVRTVVLFMCATIAHFVIQVTNCVLGEPLKCLKSSGFGVILLTTSDERHGGRTVKSIAKAVTAWVVLAVALFVGASLVPTSWLPSHPVQAQHFSSGTLNVQLASLATVYDPCQNPLILKSSAVINISSATTTELVAAAAGKVVYLCNATLTLNGTTPSIKFEYGTKVSTACDTGATALTGTYAPTAGSMLKLSDPGTQFYTPAANELCAVTAGTSTPSWQGHINYVQQ